MLIEIFSTWFTVSNISDQGFDELVLTGSLGPYLPPENPLCNITLPQENRSQSISSFQSTPLTESCVHWHNIVFPSSLGLADILEDEEYFLAFWSDWFQDNANIHEYFQHLILDEYAPESLQDEILDLLNAQ